jgi:hypothetical protein
MAGKDALKVGGIQRVQILVRDEFRGARIVDQTIDAAPFFQNSFGESAAILI